MNTQLNRIALAVICITLTGTAITALASPTVTGLKAPAELFVGDTLTYGIQGTGLCEYRLDIGNGFASNMKYPLPAQGSVIPQYKVGADENFHVYTMKITPLGTCKSASGRPITANIKVKKVTDDTAAAPVIIPTLTPTKPNQPTGSGATLAPALPTLTAISISPNTAPAGMLIFKVAGTGYCKYHISYIVKDVPLAMVPNVPYASSAQEKFPMTLTLGKPTKVGTYTYTAIGYDDCKGSATSELIIVQ